MVRQCMVHSGIFQVPSGGAHISAVLRVPPPPLLPPRGPMQLKRQGVAQTVLSPVLWGGVHKSAMLRVQWVVLVERRLVLSGGRHPSAALRVLRAVPLGPLFVLSGGGPPSAVLGVLPMWSPRHTMQLTLLGGAQTVTSPVMCGGGQKSAVLRVRSVASVERLSVLPGGGNP